MASFPSPRNVDMILIEYHVNILLIFQSEKWQLLLTHFSGLLRVGLLHVGLLCSGLLRTGKLRSAHQRPVLKKLLYKKRLFPG